jgi:hypothetical protein
VSEVLRRTCELPSTSNDIEYAIKLLIGRTLDVPVAGEAISVVYRLTTLGITPRICTDLVALFDDPKFHPTSHRQQVRLCCYRILLEMCRRGKDIICQNPTSQTRFVRTVIDSTYE